MTKPTTRARLEDALGRLLAGQPTVTNGQLTVSNLCAEAGVGRDSYYRTHGMAERFAAAKANAQTRQPELLHLRKEVAALKRDRKQLVAEHAAVVRELEDTVAPTPTTSRSSPCATPNSSSTTSSSSSGWSVRRRGSLGWPTTGEPTSTPAPPT